jgi:hypothetical protein
MMWTIWEAIDRRGVGVLTDARRRLQKRLRAKLDQKLNMLEQNGANLSTGLLGGPGVGGQRHIYELKIMGRVALRPLLCKGPIKMGDEWTFLFWAVERDNQMCPEDAPSRAEAVRLQIVSDPTKRRIYDDSAE